VRGRRRHVLRIDIGRRHLRDRYSGLREHHRADHLPERKALHRVASHGKLLVLGATR
jgi:hypothetical protein